MAAIVLQQSTVSVVWAPQNREARDSLDDVDL